MASYIVIFETKEPSKATEIRSKLKSTFNTFCPLTPHSWAIVSELAASAIRDELKKSLGPEDQLFVIRSGTEAGWFNAYGQKNADWLKKYL